jgi:hypothetical protein
LTNIQKLNIDNSLQGLWTRTTGYNRRLAKKRVQCLNEALCFVSSSVLADSLVLRNPLLRQAPKRCVQCYKRHDGATKKKHIDSQNIFGKAQKRTSLTLNGL